MQVQHLLLLFSICVQLALPIIAKNGKSPVIDNISDHKDYKKLLRTKNNVLILFTSNQKQSADIIKVFRETAAAIKGLGTMVFIDCSGDSKKMCKKLKVNPEPHIIKHYKDGEFNKDYDRRDTVSSMVNFMRDPTGDIPWEEDPLASQVHHISDATSLAKFLRRESKPIMIMFYAPWCGFCKTLKPEYADAASELQGIGILAAIDVNRPENTIVRSQYNITGFPTLLYYEHGVLKYTYEGDNTKKAIVSFMNDPQPTVKIKEPEWSDTDSEVVHLTSTSFEPVLKEEASVLVMFYAPWCGHCKRMKPEYEAAAAQLKRDGIPGMLAALDATKEQSVASQFKVKGYPTVKYFSYGEEKFDVNVRDAPKLVAFMTDPSEPPAPPPPEIPWSEEPGNVVHLDENSFKPFLKKKKHVLVIFYTPWCGHCKKTKPEFSKAANKFVDDPKVEFAAVDCTTSSALCHANDVKGYPTIKYFSYYSKRVVQYRGGRTTEEFVKFMIDPEAGTGAPPALPPGASWGEIKGVLHLTDNTFSKSISTKEPVLVMFYAPWCGHCKRMKPDYTKAAEELGNEGATCKMAMVDCTQNPEVTETYGINGFPTIKLFMNGKYVEDYHGSRTTDDLKSFMKRIAVAPRTEL